MGILKQLRKQNKFTQKEIAAQLGVSVQCYQGYEAGYRQPTPEMLCKLADIFEVSVDYLLGHEILPNKNTALLNKDGVTDVALNYIKEFETIINEKRFRDFSKLYRAMNDLQKVYMLAYIVGYLNKSGVNTVPIVGY
jgi:transcriptional regulator with XRE-family HTH domain